MLKQISRKKFFLERKDIKDTYVSKKEVEKKNTETPTVKAVKTVKRKPAVSKVDADTASDKNNIEEKPESDGKQ